MIPKCEDVWRFFLSKKNHDEVTGFVVEINTKPWRQSDALGFGTLEVDVNQIPTHTALRYFEGFFGMPTLDTN